MPSQPAAERPEARPVWSLVGLRCSGKTSVGRELARLRGVPLVDLDERVAAAAKVASAAELLRERGVPAFRALEAKVLARELADPVPLVLATGGGAVERPESRELLHTRTFCVWLREDVALLQKRLAADACERPPLVGEDAVAELPLLAARRAPLYTQVAHHVLDARAREPLAIARAVLALAQAEHGA